VHPPTGLVFDADAERSRQVSQIDEMACNELVEVVTEYLEETLSGR
jgi:hypothetical protein